MRTELDQYAGASVTFGEDDNAVIRLKLSSSPIIAKVLGTEKDKAGEINKIYLDRLVIPAGKFKFGEWTATGCISTILSK